MKPSVQHSGDCSIYIGPICDCGELRRAASTAHIDEEQVLDEWCKHLKAIDRARDPMMPIPEDRRLCPHCGSGLLFSEDRGAHCDGCDEFDPEDGTISYNPNLNPTAMRGRVEVEKLRRLTGALEQIAVFYRGGERATDSMLEMRRIAQRALVQKSV